MTDAQNAPDPTAVLGRRLLAYFIDVAIYVGVGLATLATQVKSQATQALINADVIVSAGDLDRVGRFSDGGDLYLRRGDTVYTISDSDQILAAGAFLAAFVLLAVVLQGLTGWTPGKLLTGLRTVKADGGRPGILRALVRSLLWFIDALPSYVIPLVGGATALISTGRRRLGDLAARTYVVQRRFAGAAIVHPDDDEAEPGAVVADTAPTPEDAAVESIFAGAAATDDHAATESAWADEKEGDASAAHEKEGDASAADEKEGDASAADEPAIHLFARDEPPDEPESDAAAPAEPDPTAVATSSADESVAEPDPGEVGGEEPGRVPSTPETSGDEPTAPQWDPDRRAYISYDPRRGGWVQHDTETGEWGPISRAD